MKKDFDSWKLNEETEEMFNDVKRQAFKTFCDCLENKKFAMIFISDKGIANTTVILNHGIHPLEVIRGIIDCLDKSSNELRKIKGGENDIV